MNQRRINVLRAVMEQPTAPFHEQPVTAAVMKWASGRDLTSARDEHGNVLLRHGRHRQGHRRWFFTAHMDHPGFIARSQRRGVVTAEFVGGVAREYFKGSRCRFFTDGGEVSGEVLSVRRRKLPPALLCRVKLDRPADVPPGAIGMWDLPAFTLADGMIVSRACDDLAGTAAVLCAIDEISRRRIDADVTVLLTRAEEAGFIGALAACKAGVIPPDALVVSVEASSRRSGADLGDGVVVRVGDRTRTFDPDLTAHICAVAAGVAKRRKRFRFVRQLMPGGTCESTAFQAFGYTAAALALPLDNYHNQGKRGRIAAERVNAGDFDSMVDLLVAMADSPRSVKDVSADIRARLEKLLADQQHRLT